MQLIIFPFVKPKQVEGEEMLPTQVSIKEQVTERHKLFLNRNPKSIQKVRNQNRHLERKLYLERQREILRDRGTLRRKDNPPKETVMHIHMHKGSNKSLSSLVVSKLSN